MDKLQQRAIAFSKLFDIEYKIILGRKGRLFEIVIGFEPFDFPHLIGLHKLTDVISGHISNEAMFNKCLSGEITFEKISKSLGFGSLGNRFEYFDRLESMLDSNDTVYKCNANSLRLFSQIQADYELKNIEDGHTFFLFLQHRKFGDTYYCKSFINDDNTDYTYGQTRMTLVYKEKKNKATGETVVQLNKLK